MNKFKEEETMYFIKQGLKEFPEISTGIKFVDVRRNKIQSINIDKNAQLESLDVSDNLLKSLESLDGINTLKILDAGYNLIENVPVLSLPHLKELYLMSNDICRIENINFSELQKIDMANNEIEALENLNSPSLLEIYLGANRIKKIQDLTHLKQLKILDLQYNKLRTLDCSLLPESLEVLFLQENVGLGSIKNIESLKNLKVIGLKHTQIKGIKPTESLEVW